MWFTMPRLTWLSPGLTFRGRKDYAGDMTISLPDMPDAAQLAPDEVRLELGCALYARGRLGSISAAELAGVDFVTFRRALQERSIPVYTEQMLADDLQSLSTLYPK